MIKNITAYQIHGEFYLHEGKPHASTKKKIKRIIQKNQEAKKRGQAYAPIHSYSFIDGWEEAQKTKPSKKRTKIKN